MAYIIRKFQGKTGITNKAIIRDKNSKHLKSKNLTRRSDAIAWAKPIDADREKMEALNSLSSDGKPPSRNTGLNNY